VATQRHPVAPQGTQGCFSSPASAWIYFILRAFTSPSYVLHTAVMVRQGGALIECVVPARNDSHCVGTRTRIVRACKRDYSPCTWPAAHTRVVEIHRDEPRCYTVTFIGALSSSWHSRRSGQVGALEDAARFRMSGCKALATAVAASAAEHSWFSRRRSRPLQYALGHAFRRGQDHIMCAEQPPRPELLG
jgi:hypothetical protein